MLKMIRLEDLKPNATLRGLLPDRLVFVVNIQWFGSEALELTYKTPSGRVANERIYRSDTSLQPGFSITDYLARLSFKTQFDSMPAR